MTTDELITRQLTLQAKWNGTTVEEEYKEWHKGTYPPKQKRKDGTDQKINIINLEGEKKLQNGHLPKHQADSCIYYNKFVKGIKNPCEGHQCTLHCPNCIPIKIENE